MRQGCRWDSSITGVAASRGALECLRYAAERGCRIATSTIEHRDVWVDEQALRRRAACLLFCREQGHRLTKKHCKSNVGCALTPSHTIGRIPFHACPLQRPHAEGPARSHQLGVACACRGEGSVKRRGCLRRRCALRMLAEQRQALLLAAAHARRLSAAAVGGRDGDGRPEPVQRAHEQLGKLPLDVLKLILRLARLDGP